MKDALDKQIWVRVSKDVHNDLKAKCAKNGIAVSSLIRLLIVKYLEGDIRIC